MTSTNDGKDVKSYQATAQRGKTYYIEFYKSLEAGLSSDCDLRGRTKHLCEAWRRIHSLCLHSTSTTHPHLQSWLQRHTAKIILQTEWQSSASKNEHISLTEAINDFISETQAAIKARNGESTLWEGQLLQRAEWFKKTLLSPWGHVTLKKLLDPQNGFPSDEEFVEWLKEERGIMVVTRLRQLAASKCDDLALSLATAIMDRVRAGIELHTDAEQSDQLKDKSKALSAEPKFTEILKTQAGFTSDIWELVIDIEFVLLHKCDKRSRCIELAKQTPLRTCYQLVERLENRLENSPKEKKLWKNAREVATLIAQVTIARCMVVGGCVGACRSALYWCARALTRLVAGARLVADTVALAAPAATARHLHTLAVAVHAQSTESMKPFVCELYVRALTAGMNELERLKMKTEKETEARGLEQTLSSWFTSLGSLLSGSPRVQCECTLTAFSVHPSSFMYEAIKKAPHLPPLHVDIQEKQQAIASEFGSWANDSRSQTNFVKTSETLNLKHQKQQSNILSTAILTEGEALGLSPVLCQDIAVLLSGPRLKTLSWDMDRETLLDNCRNYMERTQGGTRALTTELKYLNLDPKEFQHLPEEDDEEENDIFYGIEKGYEHLVELPPEEIWESANYSQGQSESPCSSGLDSDCYVVKLKKKSKQVSLNLSEDSDPLSLMAEAKRKAKKKERPHSKERHKDSRRKKTVEDPLDIREPSEQIHKSKEKIKNKPGRKKKDKQLLPKKTAPLSNLVGMKITKARDAANDSLSLTSVNDSDYDSQGKFSLNSINSEVINDVVFDGLYSMDELKSPEINANMEKIEAPKSSNEFCVVNGATNNTNLPIVTPCISDNTYPQFNVGNITQENGNDRNKDACTPTSLLTNANVTEEVKQKITRLIDFRRQTNITHRMSEQNNATLISLNDSINTDLLNSIRRTESQFLNRLTHSDVSNSMTRNEHDSTICSTTSNTINRQETKISNKFIHSDISNGMKRFESKTSNDAMNMDVSSYIKSFENNFLNSFIYSDMLNGINKSECPNNSLSVDTSIINRPENIKRSYSKHSNISNTIKSSDNNFQSQVTPKVVTIPDIPKVFISKKPIEETGQLHIVNNNNNVTHPVTYLAQKNDHKKSLSHVTVCNPYINPITEPQLKNQCLNQNAVKEKLLDIAQNHTPNVFTPEQSPNPIQSFGIAKQNKFQDFLKELQKSINAGAAVNNNKSLVTQTDTIPKEVQPATRITPVMPSVKKNDMKIQQNVQHKPPERFSSQKKIDNSLNTFSRLSYMHKNRQNDSKLKQVVDALVKLQDYDLPKGSVSKGPNQATDDTKNLKTNYVQSKTNVNKCIPFSASYDNTQIVTKAEKLNKTTVQSMKTSPFGLKINTSTQNSQLNFADIINENQIINRSLDKKSDKSGSICSSLSEKDQNDLVSLLRQQNKLNTTSSTKSNLTTNSEGNNISINKTSCSNNRIFNKHNLDIPCTSKVSKNEQVNKSSFKNSSISCTSTNPKTQKSYDIIKSDGNSIMSTTKISRSSLKNSDLEHHNVKKTEINKSGDLSNDLQNKPLKGTTSTDWESVMNAILAHKTPSRGPNALDVALNKSSFAKAFADSIRDNKPQDEKIKSFDKFNVTKPEPKQNIKSGTKTNNSEKSRSHSAIKSKKHATKRDPATNKRSNKNQIRKKSVSTTEVLNTNSNLVKSAPISSNSHTLDKKTSNSGTSKRLSVDAQKQFICPLPQEDDPFISGIANSDYDLLEELMDDDLRQEIGELSSDDDNFKVSMDTALKKSNIHLEKHTNDMFKKSVVITKPEVSIAHNFSELESNRKVPLSLLQCDNGVENIYTTPVKATQTSINNNPEILTEDPDNTNVYNKLNMRGSNQENNLITNKTDNHAKNNFRSHNTNEHLLSTAMNSQTLLTGTTVPQTFGNLVIVDPGVNYEQFSTSQTTLRNNVSPLPLNTYVEVNKTSDTSLYRTTPFVSPVVENKFISVTANQTVSTEIPKLLNVPEIQSSTHFDVTEIIKPTLNVSGGCKNELGNSTESKCNFNLDDQLIEISSKKGQTHLNVDIPKNNDRKVLSEVQDQQHFFFVDKNQDLITTRMMMSNDFKKINDQDRLKMKRLCIINRKIHHYSNDNPIPLSYMPLPLKSSMPNSAEIKIQSNKQGKKFNQTSAESIKTQRLDSLLNVKIQKIQNEIKCKTSKENKSENTLNLKSDSEKPKISKDNKSESMNCRRILLRSSNKIHRPPTDIDTDLGQHVNDKINKIKPKSSSFNCDDIKNLDVEKVSTCISKETNKGALDKSKDININEDSVIIQKVSRKKRKKKEKLNSNNLEQFPNNLTPTDPVDLEDQILGSKIPKNETSGATIKLQFNKTPDNTDTLMTNSHTLPQHVQNSDTIRKFDVQTQSDAINIIDSELTKDKRRADESVQNVIVTSRAQDTYKDHTDESNKVEIPQDLIDLTLENKVHTNATSLTQVDNLNQSVIQDKENLMYNQLQAKEPNVTVINKKVQNQSCLKNYSSNVHKGNDNVSGIPQFYKDSIKIIPLPNDARDPLKKFVRIKLPNGRTFKASSYGKEDVDFDMLFSNPSLKSVLLGGLTDKTCYTLNIKQVATTTLDNPKKILETRIQEINLEAKIPTGPIETIDLLSDDEDNITYQHFKTEFGDFKIPSLDNRIFTSHQKKFDQNCKVKLIPLSVGQHLPKLSACDNLYTRINNIESIKLKEKGHQTETLEIINKNVEGYIEHDSDAVEVSDIPKDTSAFITTIISEKAMVSNESISEQTMSRTDIAYTTKRSKLSDSHQSEISNNESIINYNLHNKFSSSVSKYGNCYVKLVNCDDVLKKYEKINSTQQKCVTDFIKCNDYIVSVCRQESNTNNAMDEVGTFVKQDEQDTQNTHVLSQTKVQDLMVGDILKSPMRSAESGRTSPVIDVFEKIASLNNEIRKNVLTLIQKIPICTCVAEWFVSKPQLNSRSKENLFNANCNKDRWKSDSNICVSEWHILKPTLSVETKITKNYNHQYTCKLDLEPINNVPKLTIIVNTYLQNNLNIYKAKCLSVDKNNSELNHSKNLKRKLSVDVNNDGGVKISKTEPIVNVTVTNYEQGAYNSTKGLEPHEMDNLETESNKSFDFLTVSYESDRESDVASNNSESILAEHADLFDNLILNEEKNLILNNSESEVLQTKPHRVTFSEERNIDKHESDKSYLHTGLVLEYNNTKTGMLPTRIVQSNLDDNFIKEVEVKAISKKAIAEDHKEQNILDSGGLMLQNDGSLINDENFKFKVFGHNLEMQPKLHKINSGGNYENNKHDKMYEVLDTKIEKSNETNVQDLANENPQNNYVNKRDDIDEILNDIVSNKNESSKSSSNLIICEIAPIIVEATQGDIHNPTAKCCTKFGNISQISDVYVEHSDKQADDPFIKDDANIIKNEVEVKKVTDECLPHTQTEHINKQVIDKVLRDNIYSIDNKVQMTKINSDYSTNLTGTEHSDKPIVDEVFMEYMYNKIEATNITDHYDMEKPLKCNNNSENCIMKITVSDNTFDNEETNAENIQFKKNCDEPGIIKGNSDHEYAAVYVLAKDMNEDEILNSVREIEQEECVFVIDDDTTLTDDNITETIVEMDNVEILDEDYIQNIELNNTELLSTENTVQANFDKTLDNLETMCLELKEKENEEYSKLDSPNKDSNTVDLVDSVINCPDILESSTIECRNKNIPFVPRDIKSTNCNENEIESLDNAKEILEDGHKLLQEDSENLKVLIPKVTYGNKINNALNVKQCKKILKRKIGMKDIKTIEKRYRKGKNIDHPKFTPFSCTNTLFTKEFARLSNYISSVKFSFSQPFHKENIDVPKMLTGWPIKDSYPAPEELEPSINDVLFVDLEHTGTFKATDPLEQTLTEELRSEYDESKYIVRDINENNFNMGFGEGSGRVIQNLEDGEDLKLSAATLPDVKQIQPFLLSEDYDICVQDQNAISITNDSKKDDQLNKIRHYLSYIQLKDKVQAFFRKTSKEFNSIRERNIKSKQDEDFYDTTIFPFGLTHPDFIEPGPVEAIVDVVQVGQLPVTAAAQNPVTCDPRVTQVSDASPPQCSDSSLNDDSQTSIKTEYTELTTADLSLPLRQEYANHNQAVEPQENSDITVPSENIPIETEIKSVVKIELMEELSEEKIDQNEHPDNCESPQSNKEILENVDYTFDTNSMNASEADPNSKNVYNSEEKDYNVAEFLEQKQQNVSTEKTDQIAHAMNAAGISTTETVTTNAADTLINILPENIQTPINSYTKTLPSTMSLHQALAQILPPVLNQNAENNQQSNNGTSATPQVLHIVQGKNASGNQITLVDNSQPSVINTPNSTPVLHFVQNKSTPTSSNPNGNIQSNSFSGLSLVDTGLQQGGNQLLQIVNTGNQKTSNAGQLLKQVNLLTNLTNVQGQNEQKMVQFLCKSADGKAIQLNGPHPRSMVLRIQPVESSHLQTNATKPHEIQDSSATNLGNHTPNKEATAQQEIKSRSVYEENYAKFIQNSSAKQVVPEKSTSLPKFNQAFGKQGYQDGDQKQNEINGTNSHLPSLNTTNENSECQPSENTIKLDHIGQMTSPPLLLRKSPAQTTQPQSNFIQQIKQTISPINLQSMHGSVIYRQIPVNLGSGQTINLITVPNTEVADDPNQKQQSDVKFMAQNEMEQSIIKIVPQTQPAPNVEVQQPEENNPHVNINNENTPNPQQPVLTQMRIKLPMLSKTPQMVSGARVVRPSFFQIQRNVIGANQQVYQQLVLTAAPPLGQQTAIRLPQTQNARQLKVPNDNPTASESQMSSSTLEQLREFDLVLEQVKERSTVQPNANSTAPFSQLHATNDTTDGVIATNSTSTEPTQQVLYSIGNNQPLNMSYVSRKSTIPTPTVSTYVRSPDSSGIVDSPPSSSHTQIPHTVTSDSTTIETPVHHKPTKSSKSKPRPKASSNPPNTLKLNTAPPKTSTQKPLEDEQTTQRILYILAEYKEQVENSPDKDKPAPRRRTNLPPNPGSSKRKKSSSSSRRPGGRDMSPVHGDDTCRTMGSEDSSCGTSQGDCNDCLENHSPQESPRKVVRKLSFEQESPLNLQRQIPQRNVIVADGQTITVARGTSGKPTTAVLMPANYILPVSMVKGGQQIAIVTNRGPKLLTVTSGEGGTTNALLLQRLITPAGFKPVLTRPGVRHVRLPAAALHSLQAFNFAPVTNIHPPDSTVSPAPAPTTPELVDTRANTSPWTERDSQEAKPDRGSSPEGSEPWNLPTPADPNDYSYEETVRTENMDRTVLIVHKKEGTLHRQHRLTHVSAAALRHKYAILEHELRLQKSLSEECEDLGVDSPSASELFPEAELLFAASPAHDNTQDQSQNSHSHTPQPTHSCISQPDIDDQIATDQLLPRDDLNDQQDLQLGLEDVGIVTVSEDGLQATIALDHEEFARSHPNTTFHSEPTDESEMQPFTITGIKGRHITSTIFHSHRPTGTVLMTAPQTTVISQAIGEGTSIPNPVKYSDIENIIDALPSVNENNLPSVLVKDDGLARFDSILTDSRELHLSNTASAIVHSTGNATQVIRRVCCEENKRERETTYLINESHALIAGDDAKMTAEDSSRDGTMESLHGGIEEDRSSPERHTELFWESNSASERSECRRPLDYSSDSDKCCKSPFEETNSTDSGGVGTHLRLDSVIKEARGFGVDCSLGEDIHPPLRTYPPKRLYHGDSDRSHSGKTGVGDRCSDMSDVRRRASGRGVVKRGCHCCNGSPAPPRPKKSRQKKLIADFITNRLT